MTTGKIRASAVSPPRVLPYVVALLAFVGSVAVRVVFAPVLGLTVPYITFYPAILLSAWYGGLRHGLLTTGASGLYVLYFLLPPTHTFYVRSWTDGLALLLFLGVGCFMSWAIQALHSSRRLAHQRLEKLADEQYETERSHRQIRHILESIGDGFMSVDRNWRLTYVNPAAERLTGGRASWLLGTNVWEQCPRLLGTELERRCRRVAEERVAASFEMFLENRDCWIEVNAYPAQDGGLSVSFRDITARKQAETAMARLAAIVATSDDAIISKSLDGIIQTWNAGAESLYGYSASEAVGRHASFLAPAERASEEPELLEKCRLSEGIRHYETVRVRKDGTQIEVSLTVSPLRDQAGNIVGVSHIASDISERLRIAKQFQEMQRLESLSALAAGVAHDFNNLLVGVVGNASLALDLIAPAHPTRRLIENLLAAGERAAGLAAQMLAYSGHGRFVVQRVDLTTAVREIAGPIQASIAPDVRLQLDLAGGAIPVELDLGQFKHLVASLVTNAAEAIPPGSQAVVRIATARRSIDPQLIHPAFSSPELPNGTYGCLEVEDRGCGMDDQTQARIFDPFFTTKFPGRGLGLAAAFGIVRGHKGLIGLNSARGRGTTFQIFFPLSSPEATILIANDDAAVRSAAQQALERCGYRVITAESCQAAMELLQTRADEIALAVLDLTVPVEEICRLANLRPWLRVVIAGSVSEAEVVSRFNGLGLAGTLQKPYTPALLTEAVSKLLKSDRGKALSMHG